MVLLNINKTYFSRVEWKFMLLVAALSLNTEQCLAQSLEPSEIANFNKNEVGFATDLYQTVVKEHTNENIILSPLSIYTALGLVYMGAEGITRQELQTGLRITDNKLKSAKQFEKVLDKYKNHSMVKIANKVYVQTGYELTTEFQNIAMENFKSEGENINFADSVEAAKEINSWVESKTNNKIKDLMDPNSLNTDSRMVLVNAIHFKGLWQTPFNKAATIKSNFWINENEAVQVDMMQVSGDFSFKYLSDLEAKSILLPYNNSDLAMLIILPTKRTGLKELEAKLKNVDLAQIAEVKYMESVDVIMPKFKIDFSIKLNNVLQNMGMNSMFDSRANFSGILKQNDQLMVSEVIHKAFIEVNEEGAEAAAATGVGIQLTSLPPTFEANHPFLFYLLDVNQMTVIFAGNLQKF